MLLLDMHMNGVMNADSHRIAGRRIEPCRGNALSLTVVVREQRVAASNSNTLDSTTPGLACSDAVQRLPLALAKLLVSALDETIAIVGESDEPECRNGAESRVICEVRGRVAQGNVVVRATWADHEVELTATVNTDDGAPLQQCRRCPRRAPHSALVTHCWTL